MRIGRLEVRISVAPLPDECNSSQQYIAFEARGSAPLLPDTPRKKKLYDSNGAFRGDLSGTIGAGLSDFGQPGWSDFVKEKHILLDAYQPEQLPYFRDWLLVLEADKGR